MALENLKMVGGPGVTATVRRCATASWLVCHLIASMTLPCQRLLMAGSDQRMNAVDTHRFPMHQPNLHTTHKSMAGFSIEWVSTHTQTCQLLTITENTLTDSSIRTNQSTLHHR